MVANKSEQVPTIPADVRQLMIAFKDRKFDEAIPDLLRIIEDHNQRTRALVAILDRLAPHSKDRNDAELAAKTRELISSWDSTPRMSESLANVMRDRIGHSYRVQRMAAWAAAQHTKAAPARFIARKDTGRIFSQMIGLKVPETFQEGVSHEQIDIPDEAVVKPLREDGGRAVHGLQRHGAELVDLFEHNRRYANIGEFRAKLRTHLDTKHVKEDRWLVEQLILPRSRNPQESADVKFFAFYGHVVYVLQVERWGRERVRRVFFDRDRKPVDASRFYSMPTDTVRPVFSQQDIRMAEEVSLKIPWPGVRIDFLASDKGLMFGEYTLNPGAYGGFYAASDALMGTEWAKAQARLTDDLVRGKRFAEYNELMARTTNA